VNYCDDVVKKNAKEIRYLERMSIIRKFRAPELGEFATTSQVSDWVRKRGICSAGNKNKPKKIGFKNAPD
jgi:hypothetical protein